jgi:hypothetical protein
LAALLAVSKAANAIGAHTSERAVQAVQLLFQVAEVSRLPPLLS